MKVLVTGASGRLGPFVVRDLEAAGHELVVLSRRRPEAADRWRMLALLSLAELLGMSLWFAATAAGCVVAGRAAAEAKGTGLKSRVQRLTTALPEPTFWCA